MSIIKIKKTRFIIEMEVIVGEEKAHQRIPAKKFMVEVDHFPSRRQRRYNVLLLEGLPIIGRLTFPSIPTDNTFYFLGGTTE